MSLVGAGSGLSKPINRRFGTREPRRLSRPRTRRFGTGRQGARIWAAYGSGAGRRFASPEPVKARRRGN